LTEAFYPLLIRSSAICTASYRINSTR